MKTAKRHELQTNELADWIGKKIDAIQPYSRAIVGVIVVALVAVFAGMYLSRQNAAQSAQGWQAYFAAMESGNPDAEALIDGLNEVATTFADTDAGLWARQSTADMYLSQGARQLYLDRAEAEGLFSKAFSNYQMVISNAQPPLLQQRAWYGLAATYEAQNQLDKAVDAYQHIVQQWPESSIGKQAAENIAQLSRAETRDFYQWFFAQAPRPPAPQRPDLPGGNRPIFGDLPDRPADDRSGGAGPPLGEFGDSLLDFGADSGGADSGGEGDAGSDESGPADTLDSTAPAADGNAEPESLFDDAEEVPAEETDGADASPATETPATDAPAEQG